VPKIIQFRDTHIGNIADNKDAFEHKLKELKGPSIYIGDTGDMVEKSPNVSSAAGHRRGQKG